MKMSTMDPAPNPNPNKNTAREEYIHTTQSTALSVKIRLIKLSL